MNRLAAALRKVLAKTYKSGPFSFDYEMEDAEDKYEHSYASGVLTFEGKKYEGYLQYSDKSGISWDFKPPLPESVVGPPNSRWDDPEPEFGEEFTKFWTGLDWPEFD